MPCEPKHGLPAWSSVLETFREGRDWTVVADHNGIPVTARDIVQRGTAGIKKRGEARAACTKCTPEMEAALVGYVEDNCQYTLQQLRDQLYFGFGVFISTSLISKKLCDKLYTVKQVRVESETCNNAQNIEKRREFGENLLQYEKEGAFIVYYDETNFNRYCKRTQGRALVGARAVVKLPPSKGANLQLQCAVSPEIGLVHYAKQRGSIKMEINAAFVDDVYDAVKSHETYRMHFSRKKIVVVLDNAPAHSQTEELVQARADLELLRLAPYSLMCNPIEGCFSVLKTRIKNFLALSHDEMLHIPVGQKTELRMQLLERAAEHCMSRMDLRLVSKMARHCALSVAVAIRSEPMEYGT
ncbi:Carbonic anhydrase 2 [Phytophthora cinnamomi]|uniref:Carbonic anhydrase 2 n=1 Tax=Phytophthora cinnamomi TaxID=4785 RepID=UPI0035598DDF|nr:Carbonic anhydrase 2 [Phytophthora cinnamomi]